MKVKFIKGISNKKDPSKPFKKGQEVELSKERAKDAIKRGFAVEVKEPKDTKSTQEKKSKKTTKK